MRRGVTLVASYSMAQTVGTKVQRDINQQNRIRRGLAVGPAIYGRGSAIRKGRSPSRENGINGAQGWNTFLTRSCTYPTGTESGVRGHPKFETQPCDGQSFVALISAHAGRCATKLQSAEIASNEGVHSGQLTNKEVSNLERGQSRVNRAEARAGSNGHVRPQEQGRIQRLETRKAIRVFARNITIVCANRADSFVPHS